MNAAGEVVLWRSHPSNVVAARAYGRQIGAIVLLAVLPAHFHLRHLNLWLWLTVVPATLLLWTFLQVRTVEYELTSQRIRHWQGVFSRRLVEVELYRARETALDIPFFERMAGAGNVLMNYADAYGSETLVLAAVPDPEGVRERLRQAIEDVRQRRGIRTVEAGL